MDRTVHICTNTFKMYVASYLDKNLIIVKIGKRYIMSWGSLHPYLSSVCSEIRHVWFTSGCILNHYTITCVGGCVAVKMPCTNGCVGLGSRALYHVLHHAHTQNTLPMSSLGVCEGFYLNSISARESEFDPQRKANIFFRTFLYVLKLRASLFSGLGSSIEKAKQPFFFSFLSLPWAMK